MPKKPTSSYSPLTFVVFAGECVKIRELSTELPLLHCPVDFGKSDDLELKLCTLHEEMDHLISTTS